MKIPENYNEAIKASDKEQWEQAMNEEYDSLKKNKTWELVELPKDRRTIQSKWVFRIKTKSNGEIDRYKARLVVKECSQKQGIDFKETYSPVSKYDSIRMLIAVATEKDYEIVQFNEKTTFLYGDLIEEIYMLQPEGFNDGSSKVCKLLRSLYGLKQAPLQWYRKINTVLEKFGLKHSNYDTCIY